ncbi:probable palmitoyltransferase ZDHHC11 isoform X2 [Papio anubis]|uniref:probable palmitoyltransferase ZDHHC11 isoform X2 n=1 Tax=Papio anubis TaxID=9555 RepID=UPI0012AD223A|nr:probable palmitoyltransferase ZDHHC11 isoform X2 [Papio anubis]
MNMNSKRKLNLNNAFVHPMHFASLPHRKQMVSGVWLHLESMPGTPCRFTGAPVRSPVLFTRKGVRRHGKPMMNRVYLHLGLRFKYLIHPQFMFVRSARWGSSFILPHVACELSQRHGSNRVSFPHLMIFVCLLKINWQ